MQSWQSFWCFLILHWILFLYFYMKLKVFISIKPSTKKIQLFVGLICQRTYTSHLIGDFFLMYLKVWFIVWHVWYERDKSLNSVLMYRPVKDSAKLWFKSFLAASLDHTKREIAKARWHSKTRILELPTGRYMEQ